MLTVRCQMCHSQKIAEAFYENSIQSVRENDRVLWVLTLSTPNTELSGFHETMLPRETQNFSGFRILAVILSGVLFRIS